MDLRPADSGRPTYKFLQKSKNYNILIWCHIPREQNPQNIYHHNTNLDYHSSEHPSHHNVKMTSSSPQCAMCKMCDKNLYSSNISYRRLHTESLQQFDTRSYCTVAHPFNRYHPPMQFCPVQMLNAF